MSFRNMSHIFYSPWKLPIMSLHLINILRCKTWMIFIGLKLNDKKEFSLRIIYMTLTRHEHGIHANFFWYGKDTIMLTRHDWQDSNILVNTQYKYLYRITINYSKYTFREGVLGSSYIKENIKIKQFWTILLHKRKLYNYY